MTQEQSFAPTVKDHGVQAGVEAAGQRETALIQSQMMVAMNRPRDEKQCFNRMRQTFSRIGVALTAKYKMPRGGKDVSGPSVASARNLARCWGNLTYSTTVVSTDDKTIHIRTTAIDLETNTSAHDELKFEKKILVKGNRYEWTQDEQRLLEVKNKNAAKLERNCILKLLPPDFIDEAMELAHKTTLDAANKDIKGSREKTLANLVGAFAKYEVTLEAIEDWLTHPIESLTDEELSDLRDIFQSISDGNTKPDEHFPLLKPQKQKSKEEAEDLTQRLNEAAGEGE